MPMRICTMALTTKTSARIATSQLENRPVICALSAPAIETTSQIKNATKTTLIAAVTRCWMKVPVPFLPVFIIVPSEPDKDCPDGNRCNGGKDQRRQRNRLTRARLECVAAVPDEMLEPAGHVLEKRPGIKEQPDLDQAVAKEPVDRRKLVRAQCSRAQPQHEQDRSQIQPDPQNAVQDRERHGEGEAING